MDFPKIKKKIGSYLLSEEGKISKQNLLALGSFLGTAALSSLLLSGEASAVDSNTVYHTNNLGLSYSAGTATATHTHHASHGSHASHSSY